ncbi:MAG: hypothetical protein RIS36_1240 [Pseudomonadota bacterium]|jgi:hypothetical protein
MPRGGYRVGAGRPKGSVAKITEEAVARAKEGGELPHQFLLRIVRGDAIDGERPSLQMRIAAAVAAAPYFAPKLAAIEQRVETNVRAAISSKPLSKEEFMRQYGVEYAAPVSPYSPEKQSTRPVLDDYSEESRSFLRTPTIILRS